MRKAARLYALALALVLVDQGVKYDVVSRLTTRFEGLATLGERLARSTAATGAGLRRAALPAPPCSPGRSRTTHRAGWCSASAA